ASRREWKFVAALSNRVLPGPKMPGGGLSTNRPGQGGLVDAAEGLIHAANDFRRRLFCRKQSIGEFFKYTFIGGTNRRILEIWRGIGRVCIQHELICFERDIIEQAFPLKDADCSLRRR